jgi:RNA polymerase sigma-70 factor (ECF subfamily)
VKLPETLIMVDRASEAEFSDRPEFDFAAIVLRHQSMVFSIARHFLLDPAVAEELAQDVFLELHAKLATLKSQDHVKFWLRKVTAHRCIDYRRRRTVPQISLEDAPEPSVPAKAGDLFLEERLRNLVGTLGRRLHLRRGRKSSRAIPHSGVVTCRWRT